MIDPKHNYTDQINALTATSDILGQTLAIGDTVRAFDFPMFFETNFEGEPVGRVHGLGLKGDARYCYLEGTIVQINVPYPGQTCRAYAIKPTVQVYGEGENAIECLPDDPNELVYAPLNGTKRLGGGKMFGVVKVL